MTYDSDGKDKHRIIQLIGGKERVLVYATNVDVALHQNVSVQSPIGSPRIANYPVIGSVGSSVTDDEDAVIDCSILAVVVVKNTRPEITYKHLFLECNNSICKNILVEDEL